MFFSFLNKIISLILVPIFMFPLSPVLLVKKIIYKQQDIASISAYGYEEISNEVFLTAHRGITAVAPENTLPAYEKAVELGFYSAECDIRLSKDDQWVLSHGEDLNYHFWQVGNIGDYTLEELKTFSYKNGCNFWQKDLRIPTLDEFLEVFEGTSTRPQIEIKEPGRYDYIYTVVDAVKAHGLEDQAIIIGFDIEHLKAARRADPDIELWYLADGVNEDTIAAAKSVGGNVWLSCNISSASAENIALAKSEGVGTSFWDIDSVEDVVAAYNMGARYIETDNISK